MDTFLKEYFLAIMPLNLANTIVNAGSRLLGYGLMSWKAADVAQRYPNLTHELDLFSRLAWFCYIVDYIPRMQMRDNGFWRYF